MKYPTLYENDPSFNPRKQWKEGDALHYLNDKHKYSKIHSKNHIQLCSSKTKSFFNSEDLIKDMNITWTFEDIVGSMALRSLTTRPPLQNVRFARGNKRPGSVHLHFTSGPIFSVTSNLTIPPSTIKLSPTRTSICFLCIKHLNTSEKSERKQMGISCTFLKLYLTHLQWSHHNWLE